MSPIPRRTVRTDLERQLTIERRLSGGSFGGLSERVAPVNRSVPSRGGGRGGAQHSPIWAESPTEPEDLPADWFWFDTDDPGPALPQGASVAAGTMVYRGAWAAGSYAAGEVVTHSSAVWVADVATSGEPGISGDWIDLGGP